MANLLHDIPYIWDGETTLLRPLIKPAEVDDKAEFIAPRFGDGKAGRGPRSMHGFCLPSSFNCGEIVADELSVRGREADRWAVSRFPECFNFEGFDVLFSNNIPQDNGYCMDAIMQDLEIVGLVLLCERGVDDCGMEVKDFFQTVKFG